MGLRPRTNACSREKVAALTQPDTVYWCDGSAGEYEQLAQALVDAGTFQRLSDAKRPNSYLASSDPEGWKHALPQMHQHYAEFGDKLPAELPAELNGLDRRLHVAEFRRT